MIGNKKCFKCKRVLPLESFYNCKRSKDGKQSECKECCSIRGSKIYRENKEKIKEKHRKYYSENKEAIRKKAKETYAQNANRIRSRNKAYRIKNREEILKREQKWRDEHREEYRARTNKYQRENKDKVAAWHKKYRDSHAEQIKTYNAKYRAKNKEEINNRRLKRLKEDPAYALKEKLRAVIRDSLRTKHKEGYKKWQYIIGCSREDLVAHLKKTWKDRYGIEWVGQKCNIDHIKPLAKAATEEDVIKLNHYTNLQLLTPEDNWKKGWN